MANSNPQPIHGGQAQVTEHQPPPPHQHQVGGMGAKAAPRVNNVPQGEPHGAENFRPPPQPTHQKAGGQHPPNHSHQQQHNAPPGAAAAAGGAAATVGVFKSALPWIFSIILLGLILLLIRIYLLRLWESVKNWVLSFNRRPRDYDDGPLEYDSPRDFRGGLEDDSFRRRRTRE